MSTMTFLKELRLELKCPMNPGNSMLPDAVSFPLHCAVDGDVPGLLTDDGRHRIIENEIQ